MTTIPGNPIHMELCRFHKPDNNLVYRELFELGEEAIIDRKNVSSGPASKIYTEFLISGIHFIHFVYSGAQEETVTLKSSEPYVSMLFSIKSRGTYVNRERNTVFADIGDNHHSLVYISNQDTDIHWQSEDNGEVFVINLTIDYFKRFITVEHPLYSFFESSQYENTPAILGEQSLQISPRIFTILYELANCDYKSHYKKLFIKSKVIELLMLQFEQYENVLKAEEETDFKNVNLEKMYKAREIIASNLAKPCSILDLAQQVGTNDCYLKKQFKQVFGTTVYGYLQKERMERSRELLLEGNRKISEIARMTGYKHASHFTTAFKKFFGYLPNQIRVVILSLFSTSEIPLMLETVTRA